MKLEVVSVLRRERKQLEMKQHDLVVMKVNELVERLLVTRELGLVER